MQRHHFCLKLLLLFFGFFGVFFFCCNVITIYLDEHRTKLWLSVKKMVIKYPTP